MKSIKKVLSLMLVLCMVFSMFPLDVFATETNNAEAQAASTDSTYAYNIVHVDAGRKYFSVDSLKTIIDNAAAAGFNQVELYLSDNQGFRFALDDMKVTTNYGTYDLTPALGDGYSDGSKYPDYTGKYLTQAEMTAIIAYANSKDIDIVPCINVPGHMGAILEEFASFKYSGSNSSIDLANDEAVAFALAITEKYAAYFASQGCKYYNVGADEYANDLSSMGFEGMGSALYTKFVEFLNDAADIVIDLGMTPRAFNDGFYYKDYVISVEPNKAYEVCYWSSGWNGYDVAAASTIAKKGHKMINTHGDYYWVLGNSSWQCSASKASGFDETVFQGSTISNPAGSMFCIWCDVGNADTEANVVSKTAPVIAAFGAAVPEVKSLIPAEPEVEMVSLTNNGVSVTAPGLTGLTATSITAPTIAGAKGVVAYNVTPTTASGNYTGEATVSIPVPADWTNVRGGVLKSDAGEEKLGIEGTLKNGMFTFKVPHFSDVVVYEVDYDELIELEVGGTASDKLDTYVEDTIITDDIVEVKVDGTAEQVGKPEYTKKYVTYSALANGNSSWTKTNYWHPVGDQYYPVYARYREGFLMNTYYYGYSTTDSSSKVTEISDSRWGDTQVTVYEKSGTEPTPASTTVTFTGKVPGTTYATVGETVYKIVVSKAAVAATITVDATKTYTDNSASAPVVADSSVATAELKDGTLTITGKKVGTTTVTTGNAVYTINVVAEDLSKVTPLTVEFWITNQHVTANGATSMTISAEDVYGVNGVKVDTLVPASGTQSSNAMAYWKTTRLDSDNHQSDASGDDETRDGTDFIYIRYYGGKWAYSADGASWTEVLSSDQIVAYYLQVTAVTDEVTTMVSDYGNVPGYGSSLSPFVMVDYAVKYESGEMTPESFPTTKTIAFHCNYKSSADLGNTVIKDGDTYYRKLGTIKAVETAEYEVYMITLTPTSDTKTTRVANNATGATSYTYKGTEKVVWVDDEANLGEFADETLHYVSPSGAVKYSVGGNPDLAGLEIYMNQCMLVTYYVRAKVTEDSLTVNYVDQTNGVQFYTYNIAVNKGDVFNANIGLNTPNWKGDLVNGTVTNIYNKAQTVSADLGTMPAIGAQYRQRDYTCVKVVRSDDGKTVTLYYTFSDSKYFVVDFGLPIVITAEDLGIKVTENTTYAVTNGTYGTAGFVDETIVYTPTTVLQDVDEIQLSITDDTGTATHYIHIMPATTVYYEPTLAELNGVTVEGTLDKLYQATETLTNDGSGKENNYGYDPTYAGGNVGTNATVAENASTFGTANFTFTGTGVDIYANCTPDSGIMTIIVRDAAGALKKLLVVDTHTEGGDTSATGKGDNGDNQAVTSYSLPVASIEMADGHGTYSVEVRCGANTSFDGFRVYNTLEDSTVFEADLEDNPEFYELRDYVLKALNISSSEVYGSVEEMATQVYNNGIRTSANEQGDTVAAVLSNSTYNGYSDEEVQDLLDNGPKNELFLWPGQSLVFSVKTDRVIQLGMKAPNGAVTYTVGSETKLTAVNDKTPVLTSGTITTSTDMFYVLGKGTGTHTITVTNNSGGILSITDLKICDDPNFTFNALTEQDIETALYAMGYGDTTPDTTPTPEVTTTPEATPTPEATTTPEATPTPEVTTTPEADNKPTGDDFAAMPWMLALLASAAVAVIAVIGLRKRSV